MNSHNKNRLIILGSGTSTGVPIIGCNCAVCTSLDHRDQRLRTSIYIKTKRGKNILVDTTPDLRTQFLDNKLNQVDFVIITHEHADHLHGLDDLRPLGFGPPKKQIPIYTTANVKNLIENRFEYIFKKRVSPALGGGTPNLRIESVNIGQKQFIEGEEFYFFTYPHGHSETMGFIHEGLAYIVDCNEIPKELLVFLINQKLQLLIIDCLQRHDHSTHLTVKKSFDYIGKIGAKRSGLIHMSHDLLHSDLATMAAKTLDKSVFPVFDQLNLYY
jgi:phosphoribosyl 1,2-cyclic phosphate phosphodiesterase